MKLHKWLIMALLTLWACNPGDNTVSVKTLLSEMTGGYTVPINWTAHMTSSHDRSSVNQNTPEWFANNDGFGFERIEINSGRVEKVLMEDSHPGAITRLWLTTMNPKGLLRFYFDGHQEPDWIVPGFDLTEFGIKELEGNPLLQCHTSYEHGVKGGQTLFLPIPYAKSCKVTFEEPEGWTSVPRYYQIEYRRYGDDIKVESFGIGSVRKYSSCIVKAGKVLSGQPIAGGHRYSVFRQLAPGESIELTLPSHSSVVKELNIVARLDGIDSDLAMRSLIFEGVFDGEKTISVPLSDYQGSGLGCRPVKTYQMIADGKGSIHSFWPMPYDSRAVLQIYNNGHETIPVMVEAKVKKEKFRGYHFHCDWHAGPGLRITNNAESAEEWDFVRLSGRGFYAGDNLTLFNHSKAWYGEGDEKIFIDGESFPSFFGTGTEDYYNSSWAPVVVFHTPWGGAPRADLTSSRGYNTFLRTRIADVIPFNESLEIRLEQLSWSPGTVDFFRTAYWYGAPEAKALNSDDPKAFSYVFPEAPPDPTTFAIKNAIECESLEPQKVSDGLLYNSQDMRGFPEGIWSNGKQWTFFAGKTGDMATFELAPKVEGTYSISLYGTRANDYGIIEISLNEGKPTSVDCYFPDVVNSGEIRLGEATTKNGVITMTIRIAGQNPLSRGNMFGLDYILMDKI
ncbi:MAG: DUF2961 domain-containing protein [Bacteroidales bacterium]|nr:DUF2961 domain-containing protein [Bacteroidales bacterium]